MRTLHRHPCVDDRRVLYTHRYTLGTTGCTITAAATIDIIVAITKANIWCSRSSDDMCDAPPVTGSTCSGNHDGIMPFPRIGGTNISVGSTTDVDAAAPQRQCVALGFGSELRTFLLKIS